MTPEKFWSQHTKTPSGCWEWSRYRTRQGYGTVNISGVQCVASRASWTLTYGAIPKGLKVLHKCDNPACVNPEHLFLGTSAMNSQDMVSKNRQAKGSRHGMFGRRGVDAPMFGVQGAQHPRTKISEDVALAIREAKGYQHIIAKTFHVSQSLVCRIKSRELWRNLP